MITESVRVSFQMVFGGASDGVDVGSSSTGSVAGS